MAAKKSGAKKASRLHYDYALTGKLEKQPNPGSTIHPKPYKKGGSVKGRG